MKILYVITGLGQGGAEKVLCDLADDMSEKGYVVKIAYLTGPVITKPANKDIELIKVNLNSYLSIFSAYNFLKNLIKNYRPDIIHTHMVHANLFLRMMRLTTPMRRLISTAHNSNEGGWIRMILYRLTHGLSDLTTNVSGTATEAFELRKAVPKGGMKTIYNGIDIDHFSYNEKARNEICNEFNIDINTSIILAVGRFSEQKNYPNLLNASKLLKEKKPNFKLLIAGDGELRDKIERLIQELNLMDNVILLGRRSDISRLMSACDLFVLSSDYEGLPTVLIEAISCQARVVSTDVSGASEIINGYGVIVPVHNSFLLYKAMESSLKHNEKNIGGANYVRATFSLETIAKKWLEIYI